MILVLTTAAFKMNLEMHNRGSTVYGHYDRY
jgi:hypothetical protein